MYRTLWIILTHNISISPLTGSMHWHLPIRSTCFVLVWPHHTTSRLGAIQSKTCLAGLYASQTNRPKTFTSFKDKDEDVARLHLPQHSLCLPSSISPEAPATTPYMRVRKSKTKKRKTYLLHSHATTERFEITLVVGFELSWRTYQLYVLKSLNSE